MAWDQICFSYHIPQIMCMICDGLNPAVLSSGSLPEILPIFFRVASLAPWSNPMIAPVPLKQSQNMWVNDSHEIIKKWLYNQSKKA